MNALLYTNLRNGTLRTEVKFGCTIAVAPPQVLCSFQCVRQSPSTPAPSAPCSGSYTGLVSTHAAQQRPLNSSYTVLAIACRNIVKPGSICCPQLLSSEFCTTPCHSRHTARWLSTGIPPGKLLFTPVSPSPTTTVFRHATEQLYAAIFLQLQIQQQSSALPGITGCNGCSQC